MKKLPPNKRNQLILVSVATLAVLGLVFYFLIQPQQQENAKLATDILNDNNKLAQIKKTIQQSEANAKTADEIVTKLSAAEVDVANGDIFAWMVDTVRRFKAGYKIEIPNITQMNQGDCDLINGFPYKQTKYLVSGTGYYHDIGKFVSDFENNFPHIRVLNVWIDPVGEQSPEKLSFRMEIATLTKPGN